MKATRFISLLLIFAILTLSLSSCYVIAGQKMRVVKGTYKLTQYTYTPQYEPKDGYVAKTYDYVNGEEYKFEDYLIVTGEARGYYVHKSADGDNYIKEINLRYEYDTVDTRKINYVIYNDSITGDSDTGMHRLGVMRNSFNYSKSAIDFSIPSLGHDVRTESINISWKKITRSDDVSKVTRLFDDLKYYDYVSFCRRGVYEMIPKDGQTSEYDYFYYVIDTPQANWSAAAYYSPKGTGEQKKKLVGIVREEDDWSAITIDGMRWTTDPLTGDYTVTIGGVEYICSHVSYTPTQTVISNFIADRLAQIGGAET